jgi:hypothetical protein
MSRTRPERTWVVKKKGGLTKWLKQYSTCLASVKPQVQTPILPKKKTKVFFILSAFEL